MSKRKRVEKLERQAGGTPAERIVRLFMAADDPDSDALTPRQIELIEGANLAELDALDRVYEEEP